MPFPHLSKAPIQEALLHFDVQQGESFEIEALGELEDVRESYPRMGTEREFQAELHISSQSQRSGLESLGIRGYRYGAEDGKGVAQFMRDGFSYNVIKSYGDWGQFSDEALRLWEIYQNAAEPEQLVGLTTRFINRIHIPFGATISDYFRMDLSLPKGMEGGIRSFSQRVEFVEQDTGLYGNISLASTDVEEEFNNERSGITILDVSVRVDVNASLPVHREDLSEQLEQLHEVKNKMFFGSLTAHTVNQYR